MTLPSSDIDIIATQILVDAKSALATLKELDKQVANSATRISLLANPIQSMAKQAGSSVDTIVAKLQKLNAAKPGKFGFLGVTDADISRAGEIAKQANLMSRGVEDFGNKSTQAGAKAESAFSRVTSAVNVVKIALGALVSMLLFRFIQAVEETFRKAIEQAKAFEATLYRIANAERQLSLEGVEVSVKGLKDGIDDIKKAFPIFSKEDIAELIGGIATTTKELGFTEEQILKLGAAVAILNINSTETETLLQTMGKVANSLISPQAKSIGNLGLAFGKAKIEAKAFEMQLLQTGESFEDLTEKEKTQIKYQIVLETANIEDIDDLEKLRDVIKEAGGDFAALDEYLKSNAAKLDSNTAAWNDLLTTLGQIVIPFLPALTEFFEFLNGTLIVTKVYIIELITRLGTLAFVMADVFTGQITNMEQFVESIKNSTEQIRTELVNTFFKEVPEDAPDWFMRGWGDRIKEAAETATGNPIVPEVDNEDALKALEEIEEKIQDILLSAQQAREDLEIRLEQKQDDLDVEYLRKEEDALRDHNDKIVDINQDAVDRAEDARRRAREDEVRAERDLLQKLKELRQRFLFDLEDALHARDARQVLRLIREYKAERQNILDRAALEEQERKDRLATELRNIEIERQRRIESANIEYQRKLADLALAKQREQEELQLWYQREQEDIERNVEQKLEKLLAGYIAEGEIHEEQQAAIYAILKKWLGKDMQLVDHLANFMATRFAEIAAMAQQVATMPFLGGSGGQNGAPLPYWQLLQNQINAGLTGSKGGRRMAEGGTIIANRPTAVMFGERGAEAATFTPLDRAGKDVNRIFNNLSNGGGGMGGEILIGVDLSPDLEARVIQKSMNGVGNVIAKVNRKKL